MAQVKMGMALANSGIGRHHAKKGLARDEVSPSFPSF